MAATTVLSRWPIVAMVVLLSLGALSTIPSTHLARPGDSSPVRGASTTAPCYIPLPASGVHGELTIDGGPLTASAAAGVTLNYTFTVAYRTVDEPNNTLVAVGCIQVQSNTTTTANGSFSFIPVAPSSYCATTGNGTVCMEYSIPFAPVNMTVAGGPPLGYGVSVKGWDASIAVALVYELANVTVTPGGPTVTTSVGAPIGFSAAAWEANGSRSPLEVSFLWSVNGTGWAFEGSRAGSSVSLLAVLGASVATLTVRVSASVRGTMLDPASATVDVVAVPTEIETGETNRTTIDAGGTIGVRLTAFGAAGFAYSAFVEPGLGLPATPASCSVGLPEEGTVEIDCEVVLTYAVAGTAQPTANITNGYSTGTWRFPNVVVSPPPELEVTPASPAGYALDPVTITVNAANGSGAQPYQRACLRVDPSAVVCDASPGPVWSFAPTFPNPGEYAASSWAVDADGSNASISFSVEIVPPFALSPIGTSAENATVGSTVVLNATVSGGLLPLHYWWNASGSSGSLLDGSLAVDGSLNVTIVPTDPGPLAIRLTVVDRLGTVVASDLLLSVGPAPAVRVAPITASPSGPVLVGVPVSLAWGAFDLSGALDGTFQAAVDVVLSSGVGAPEAWVNASGVGPLDPLGGGEYGVPASAWIDGVLAVTVTVGTAASVTVDLSGSALPGDVAPLTLDFEADRAHVQLYAPTVVHAGERSNATFWHVRDRFGNPVPGALLTVDLSFGGVRDDTVIAAITLPGGASGVWVNYSSLTAGVGEVTVVDAAGDVILGPISVPATSTHPVSRAAVDVLAAIVPTGAAGAAGLAVVRRRRRAGAATPAQEELRCLAEGRARTVELIGRAGSADLTDLEAAWDPPPAPPALADWLASLVADGTVRATVGDDGRARFCLAGDTVQVPRVTVDPQALERSLQRRDEELRSGVEDEESRPG